MVSGGFLRNRGAGIDAPYLSSKASLVFELTGKDQAHSSDCADEWFHGQNAPYKYRILGKIPVWLTYCLVRSHFPDASDAFYFSYVLWTFVFIFLFLLASMKLTAVVIGRIAGEEDKKPDGMKSLLLYAFPLVFAAPVLFAFKFPVHGSPNEFLGYFLISMSLLALCENRLILFLCVCILSIFCRETNMIVMLPFLLNASIPRSKRIALLACVMVIFFIYRISWPGLYNPFESSAHNFKYPLESLLFLFMTFGPFWILGIAGWHSLKQKACDPFVRSLVKSFIPSLLLVLVIITFLARMREIRILYVIFFYFSIFSSYILLSFWEKIRKIILSGGFILYALACVVVSFIVYVTFMPENYSDFKLKCDLFGHLYGGFGGGWVPVLVFYQFVTLLSVPLIFNKFRFDIQKTV